MTCVLLRGEEITLAGNVPQVGETFPDFTLIDTTLQEVKLSSFNDKKKILNIFPSVDTPVCHKSVLKFGHDSVKLHGDVKMIHISADLPFAQKRVATEEEITNLMLSTFRNPQFGKDTGLEITSGPLVGLLARCVVVLDENNKIHYCELVPEIGQEPNYDNALATFDKANWS